MCVTCGSIMPWKKSQAGHFVPGRNNSVLLREDLVHTQCYRCNCCLGGNLARYMIYMMESYGYTKEQIKELLDLKFKVKPMTRTDWEEKIAEYEQKLKDLGDIIG